MTRYWLQLFICVIVLLPIDRLSEGVAVRDDVGVGREPENANVLVLAGPVVASKVVGNVVGVAKRLSEIWPDIIEVDFADLELAEDLSSNVIIGNGDAAKRQDFEVLTSKRKSVTGRP